MLFCPPEGSKMPFVLMVENAKQDLGLLYLCELAAFMHDDNALLCWDKIPTLSSQLIRAVRAQVYYMSDCKRKCSLFIHEKCSVNLQEEALVANQCGLFPFHTALLMIWTKTKSTSLSVFKTVCLYFQVLPDSCQSEGATPGPTQSWDQSTSPGR